MTKRDYYDVLGIGRNADEKEIKRAYRKLAKQYHPDTNPGDKQAEQRFKEITEAYNVLSDKEKRAKYDQFGSAAFDEADAGSGAYGGNGAGSGFYGSYGNSGFGSDKAYREFHFGSDGMGNMGGIFDDLFGGMFHGREDGFHSGSYQRSRQSQGGDLQSEVSITFEEAALGCDKVIRLQSADGSGKVQSLKVHIPAGIDDGKSIRLRGKGMPGIGGGSAGNLLLKVHIAQKPGFTRKGQDVYTSVSVPFTTAVFGGEASVQTLYGNVICKVPAGMQSGSKIRLRGKGIVSMNNPSLRGDQYVSIQIQVPTDLSPQEKQKLKEFEQLRKGRSRGHVA